MKTVDTPLVSVLIPVYNVDKYLPQCIDSIKKQSYDNLHVVLIDDGSTDNSLEIAEELCKDDSRFEIYSQENHGISYTRNKLLEKVKGSYILYVDSDDWIEDNMVEFLVSTLTRTNADIVTCESLTNEAFPVSNEFIVEKWDNQKTIKEFLIHKKFKGSLWNKLIKSSLFSNLSFNAGVSYGEDALIMWDLIKKIDTVVYTDRQLYHYRINADGITRSSFCIKQLSIMTVWKKIYLDTKEQYSDYLPIANNLRVNAGFSLLKRAAYDNYELDANIEELQSLLRVNLNGSDVSNSIKNRFVSYLLIKHYGIVVAIYKIKKLISL